MADQSEQSQAERDESIAQTSMSLVATYANHVVESLPRNPVLKRKVLRENLRTLFAALAAVDGHQNTSEFLEIYSIKYSKTVPDEPSPSSTERRCAEVIQFSERYRIRKAGRPSS